MVAWSVAVPVALWALIRTFGLESGYPLVPLISYTPYVTATSLVALAACLLLRRWAAAVVAGVAALALVSAIAPRMIGSDYSNSEGVRLTVMTANVYKGQGDPEQLLAYVRERDVDVLAVQELTPMFVEAFEREGIGGELRFTALAPREGVTGSGIYSRHHLTDTTSGRAEFLQMSALVEVAGAVSVVSVHPKPPTSSRAVEEWESSLDQFQLPSDEEDLGATQLLLGDFNATLDQAAFRDVLDRGYLDAGEEVGSGLIATWPAIERSLRYRPVTIDHLLAEEDEVFGVRDYEVLDLDGSDHRPVVAELVLRPPGG